MNPIDVELPTGQLQVTVEQARLPLDDLLGFAARANLKRGFLFLSKVLGKHWPVRPRDMRAIHQDLARRIPSDLPGPVLFIALAETAIGLGQGVFEAWLAQHQPSQPPTRSNAPPADSATAHSPGMTAGLTAASGNDVVASGNDVAPPPAALFLHSSRYRLGAGELIEFAEAHSHAPRQFLHVPTDPALAALLAQARSLVLVDDEASTGNTFVNLCHALRQHCPQLARVHVAVITDFMGESGRAALAERIGLPLECDATLRGHYTFAPGQLQDPSGAAQRFDASGESGASSAFGRLGIAHALGCIPQAPPGILAADTSTDNDTGQVASITSHLPDMATRLCAQIAPDDSVLVLGTGEFMHAAFLLGQALEMAGLNVKVQSTTRSPILLWGAVSAKLEFPDNYGEGIGNYLYNVEPGQYRHVFICHETPCNAALLQLAHRLNARLFHFQSEDHIEEIPVR